MKEGQFVYPGLEHEKIMQRFVKEIKEHDQSAINGIGLYEKYADYKQWIKFEETLRNEINVPENLVPASTYLYVVDNEVIGTINIRHCLNDGLLKKGGHIGYSVVPSKRRQGYATYMLNQALKICKEKDIWPVLVTCDQDNVASQRTIEKCGGHFHNQIERTLRYWIGEDK